LHPTAEPRSFRSARVGGDEIAGDVDTQDISPQYRLGECGRAVTAPDVENLESLDVAEISDVRVLGWVEQISEGLPG